jgi:hypothetical protein
MLRQLSSCMLMIPLISVGIILGTIAFFYLVGGVVFIVSSWLILIFPDLLETFRISFLGVRMTEPFYIFLLFLISGSVSGTMGSILSGFLFFVVKTFQILIRNLFYE